MDEGRVEDDRLDELERRLAALEAVVGATAAVPSPVKTPTPADAGGTFWALDGLRARTDEAGGVLVTGLTALPTGGRAEWQEGHPAAEVLDDDWEPAAPVISALGHPVRLRLLRAVLHGTTTAAGLTAMPGVGTSGQVYHHLRQLTAAGWLRPAVGADRGAHEVPVARVVPLLAVLAVCRP